MDDAGAEGATADGGSHRMRWRDSAASHRGSGHVQPHPLEAPKSKPGPGTGVWLSGSGGAGVTIRHRRRARREAFGRSRLVAAAITTREVRSGAVPLGTSRERRSARLLVSAVLRRAAVTAQVPRGFDEAHVAHRPGGSSRVREGAARGPGPPRSPRRAPARPTRHTPPSPARRATRCRRARGRRLAVSDERVVLDAQCHGVLLRVPRARSRRAGHRSRVQDSVPAGLAPRG
jgi:hypothetical protein